MISSGTYVVVSVILAITLSLRCDASEDKVFFDLTADGKAVGRVVIALESMAPNAAKNFKQLSTTGVKLPSGVTKSYQGSKFHRLTTEDIFVLQGGDIVSGNGEGHKCSIFPGGKPFDDENLHGATYPAGTVAMANTGPNTNGCQFFLIYEDTPLPPNYTVFGAITQGLNVLKKIAAKGTADGSTDGPPKHPVVISKSGLLK